MKKNNLLISLIVATGLILSFSGCSEDGYTEISLAQDQKAELTLASREYTELVELTGSVESKTETQVASKTAGRIANLLVDIGDEVQNGELIAVLAADETAVNLETSRINVENLDNTIAAQAKLLDQQIKSGEAAVRVAEANLEALELSEDSTAGSIAEQISLAEEQLKSAETQLQNTEEIAEQRLNSVYQTVNSALLNTLIVSENANNFADGLFNVSGEKKFFNEDIRRFLGTLEPQVKNDVKKTLQATLREWDIYKTLYDEQIKNSELTREEANSYLNQALTLLENIKIMLTDTYEVLDKSSVGAGFTEQDLTNLKNQTAQHAQEVEKAILTTSGNLKLGVKGILLTVDEIKTQNQAELSAAQSNIANAQQAVSAAKAGGKQNITNLDSQEIVIKEQIAQAKSQVESLKAQKEAIITELASQKNLAIGNQKLAEVQINNTQVKSPFRGVVTEKYAEIGTVVGPGQALITLADNSNFKIETEIPDNLVKDLQLGTKAQVVINGVNGSHEARVSKIDPKVNPQTRKLGLELDFTNYPEGARLGMFTEITIKIVKPESFFVPREFVESTFEGSFIQTLTGEEIEVATGITKDGEVKIWYPEIKEGVVLVR